MTEEFPDASLKKSHISAEMRRGKKSFQDHQIPDYTWQKSRENVTCKLRRYIENTGSQRQMSWGGGFCLVLGFLLL